MTTRMMTRMKGMSLRIVNDGGNEYTEKEKDMGGDQDGD